MFDPHFKARSRSTAKHFSKPSRTVKSQAYECDINNMVKGLTPFTQSRRQSFFIDETLLPLNYEEQFNAVLRAQDSFMLLPPDVRQVFKNDPAVLAEALSDPSQHARLVELGVLPSPSSTPAKEGERSEPAPKGAKGSGGREPPAAKQDAAKQDEE